MDLQFGNCSLWAANGTYLELLEPRRREPITPDLFGSRLINHPLFEGKRGVCYALFGEKTVSFSNSL